MTNFDAIKNTRLSSQLRNIYFALSSLDKNWNKPSIFFGDKNAKIKFVNGRRLFVLKQLNELKEYAEKNLSSEIIGDVADIYEEVKCQLDDLDSLLKRWNENHIHKIPNSVEELMDAQVDDIPRLDFSGLDKSDLEMLIKAFVFKCNTAPESEALPCDFQILVGSEKPFPKLNKRKRISKFVDCFVSNGKKYKIFVKEDFYGFVIAKGLKKYKVRIGEWPSKIDNLKDSFNEWSKAQTIYEGSDMTNWMKLAYVQASLVQSKFISSCGFEEEFYGFQRLVRLCFGRRETRRRLSV